MEIVRSMMTVNEIVAMRNIGHITHPPFNKNSMPFEIMLPFTLPVQTFSGFWVWVRQKAA